MSSQRQNVLLPSIRLWASTKYLCAAMSGIHSSTVSLMFTDFTDRAHDTRNIEISTQKVQGAECSGRTTQTRSRPLLLHK